MIGQDRLGKVHEASQQDLVLDHLNGEFAFMLFEEGTVLIEAVAHGYVFAVKEPNLVFEETVGYPVDVVDIDDDADDGGIINARERVDRISDWIVEIQFEQVLFYA